MTAPLKTDPYVAELVGIAATLEILCRDLNYGDDRHIALGYLASRFTPAVSGLRDALDTILIGAVGEAMNAPGFAPPCDRHRAQRLHGIASDLGMIDMSLSHPGALVKLLTGAARRCRLIP